MCVGRLHHKKGLDLLPEVLGPLADLAWDLVFVGDDADGTRQLLQRAFSTRRLDRQVVFLGGVPAQDLARVYSAADLVLLPSRHENFANVLAEALACGTPVATTPQVGLARSLTTDGVGLVIEREVGPWRATLAGLISNSRPLGALRAGAAAFASRFQGDVIAAQMAGEYRRCIANIPSPRVSSQALGNARGGALADAGLEAKYG